MPYNPGISDRRGEFLAQGISSFGQSLASGLDQYYKNERERRTAAGQIMGAWGQDPSLMQGIDPALITKVQTGKASLADTYQVLGQITSAQAERRAQQQKALQDQQIATQRAQQAAAQATRDQALYELGVAQANVRAMQAAGRDYRQMPSPDNVRRAFNTGAPIPTEPEYDPTAAAATYMREGGTNPAAVNALAAMQRSEPKGFVPPRLLDMGGGVQAVWSPQTGNAQLVRREPVDKTKPVTGLVFGEEMVEFGGKTFRKDPKTGKTVLVQGERPLDPTAMQMYSTSLTTLHEQIATASKNWNESKEEFARRVGALKQRANVLADLLGFQSPYPDAPPKGQPPAGAAPATAAAPVVVNTPEEFAALPPGTKFIWRGRTGIKK
jgi:hypothetical protein